MKIIFQLTIIFGIALIGALICAILPFPFPVSVMGMLLMSALLFIGAIKEETIAETSNFLLQNMVIFFVPSGISILEYLDLLSWSNIWKIVVICVGTTVLTFGVTALTVKLVLKIQRRWKKEVQA